ncbi:ICln family transporter: chloride ion current inducer protein I(Cln) [Dorcoceras hygrometricum]|uniref:ICln family transporter: chloride ion current inducer protein I(Cln) n=1 Tax=Dorcoceras hygrometricum TaxID=472368 RepID=A0A2Z7AQ51_9LAMI|nr:ICln family transporter: chloride ion current inducer protein I(Cln) [Dorcoceras hygrometricum]
MAASFYSNSVHVDFDSVLEMDEPGMVSMFQALVASGLQGFLGCTAVVYEEALVEFFANGRVRDGLVVSSVDGVFVEISEEFVQLSLDQHQSSSSSTDSSSSLRFDQTDVDATASSLPPASQDLSAALADLHATLSEKIFEYQSDLFSKLHKIEQSVCDSLRDQADIFRNLSQGARQEARTLDDVQTIRFNDFRKHVPAQNASIFTGLADVRQEVQAVNAKVDIMASRLNDIQKDAEATKEALSHQLLEFQSSAQENHSVLHAQLSELVDYIHRGGADKKGESGSRGLQQPSNVQVSASAERTPSFAQRVEMAQRHIFHTVLDADANRALFERQDAAERDRERRRREARVLKRRRRD